MAAPTFVAEYESATWVNTTADTPLNTGSIAANTNDVIVTVAVNEESGSARFGFTGTGFTVTKVLDLVASTYPEIGIGSGVVATGGTVSVEVTKSGSHYWGINALRFSGSDGVGALASASSLITVPSVDITTTQANSAIVVVIGDSQPRTEAHTWKTINGSAPTEVTVVLTTSIYKVYIAYYADAGAIGTYSAGLSGPTGTWLGAIAAYEVKGTAAAQSNVPRAMLLGIG